MAQERMHSLRRRLSPDYSCLLVLVVVHRQIEAISFLHFLRHGTIITLAEVQAFFMDGDQVILPITPQRYLLGLSDLSGEMMRFATNALGTGEAEDVVATVLSVLRELTSGEEGHCVSLCTTVSLIDRFPLPVQPWIPSCP